MKPEAQRIAIAKACGWKFIEDYCHGADQPPEYTTVTPEGKKLCGYYPDYCNDLNSMHEAEKELYKNPTYMQQHAFNTYAYRLIEMCKHQCNSVHATAEQRAEAFLKTLNLWEP